MTAIQHLNLEFDSIAGVINNYSQDTQINNYLAKLKKGIAEADREAIVYCLDAILNWYAFEMDNIIKNPIDCKYDLHQANKNLISSILNEFRHEGHTKNEKTQATNSAPLIFISHKSDDKKYGNALRNFLIGLGVKNSQLVYTSHPLNGVPTDADIYDYLRQHIASNNYIIFLLSDKYFESSACLNEMGAAWVVQADYSNIYVPTFDFNNPRFTQSVANTKKMGIVLNGDETCRIRMLELKNKVQSMFQLGNDELTVASLLNDFIEEIS